MSNMKKYLSSLLGLEAAQEKAKELYQDAITALESLQSQGYNTDLLEL